MSQKSEERFSEQKKSASGSREDLTKLILDSGKWLDQVDETLLKHFAIFSETFHPLYPAIYRCLE